MTTSVELISAVDSAVTRVRTRAVDISFNELFDMHASEELVINPDFQRLFRWSESKQSQFIESLVLELPIPPIYAIEIEDGVYELIDGLQRISSYLHFRGKNPNKLSEEKWLRLQGCDVLPALNNNTYPDLPHALQIKLKRHFIRMEVLRRESDNRLRYHMFKRLNTGGELLSPQEIRNCTIRLLSSEFVDFLKRLADNAHYKTCMDGLTPEKREQMYMEEYILRFFAFKNFSQHYVKDIGTFLTEFMEGVSDPSRSDIPFDYALEERIFNETFRLLAVTLETSAFSGYNAKGNPSGNFSALIFESLTLGIQDCVKTVSIDDSTAIDALRDKLVEIKKNAEFQGMTTGGGKNFHSLHRRRVDFVRDRIANS